jgi:lambda family phage minor tail protein L
MSIEPEIASEIQKLEPSAIIELFELDSTELGGEVFRFHNGTNKLHQNLVWQGNTYVRFPINVSGFEITGQGQFPRPTVTVSNVMSAMTTVLLQYGDLIGSKFTRKRTLLKYLDAVNFPGGVNSDADPTVFLADDVYYVDRKSLEDQDQVQFELASVVDLQGVRIPARTVIQNVCPWIYRGPDCNYTGIPLWDENDNVLPMPTSPEAINMRVTYAAYLAAEAALAATQATLATAANTMTAASKYTTETRFNQTPAGSENYCYPTIFGAWMGYWNGAPVTIGSSYQAGAPRGTMFTGFGAMTVYEIVKYSRDETAYTSSVNAYNAAITARDAAQANLTAAKTTFDDALVAVPPTDQVYKDDRCGKRVTSCKLRFGATNPLNFGGFPGVAK